jgi:hypothetical protein
MWKAVGKVIEKIKIKIVTLLKGGRYNSESNTNPNGGHFL